MMFYGPDGTPLDSSLKSKPRHCFLITRLGAPIPREAKTMRTSITKVCHQKGFEIIDASAAVTGRDFLLKIWRFIASTPVSVGICHEEFPVETIKNVYLDKK